MKLKKRKIKYAALFFICWFALLTILVDGVSPRRLPIGVGSPCRGRSEEGQRLARVTRGHQ